MLDEEALRESAYIIDQGEQCLPMDFLHDAVDDR